MLRLLRVTWRMIYFWKLLLVGAVLLFTIAVLSIGSNDFDLDFGAGIKAPIFAIASAATLFIGMIPKNPGPNDVLTDVVVRPVGTFTACLAGWFWLLGETKGDPSPYVLVLTPVIALISFLVLVLPLLSHMGVFFLDGITSPGPSEDE